MSKRDEAGPADTGGRRRTIAAKAKWTEAVLVCGKCLKKAKGGKRFRRDLETALADATGVRRAKAIRTGCLGLCPKGGIVVASGNGLASGRLLVAREGASGAEVVAQLLPSAPADGRGRQPDLAPASPRSREDVEAPGSAAG